MSAITNTPPQQILAPPQVPPTPSVAPKVPPLPAVAGPPSFGDLTAAVFGDREESFILEAGFSPDDPPLDAFPPEYSNKKV